MSCTNTAKATLDLTVSNRPCVHARQICNKRNCSAHLAIRRMQKLSGIPLPAYCWEQQTCCSTDLAVSPTTGSVTKASKGTERALRRFPGPLPESTLAHAAACSFASSASWPADMLVCASLLALSSGRDLAVDECATCTAVQSDPCIQNTSIC